MNTTNHHEETRMATYNHDPAVELAQAELLVREWLPFTRDGEAMCWVMVEYDRRGNAINQLTDDVVTLVESNEKLRAEREAARNERDDAEHSMVLAKRERDEARLKVADEILLRRDLWEVLDREPPADRDLVETVRNMAVFQDQHVTPMLAELEQLRRQRDAVLEIHQREDSYVCGGSCSYCRDADEDPIKWPCPTVQALGVES